MEDDKKKGDEQVKKEVYISSLSTSEKKKKKNKKNKKKNKNKKTETPIVPVADIPSYNSSSSDIDESSGVGEDSTTFTVIQNVFIVHHKTFVDKFQFDIHNVMRDFGIVLEVVPPPSPPSSSESSNETSTSSSAVVLPTPSPLDDNQLRFLDCAQKLRFPPSSAKTAITESAAPNSSIPINNDVVDGAIVRSAVTETIWTDESAKWSITLSVPPKDKDDVVVVPTAESDSSSEKEKQQQQLVGESEAKFVTDVTVGQHRTIHVYKVAIVCTSSNFILPSIESVRKIHDAQEGFDDVITQYQLVAPKFKPIQDVWYHMPMTKVAQAQNNRKKLESAAKYDPNEVEAIDTLLCPLITDCCYDPSTKCIVPNIEQYVEAQVNWWEDQNQQEQDETVLNIFFIEDDDCEFNVESCKKWDVLQEDVQGIVVKS